MIEFAEARTIEPVFAFHEEDDRYLLKGVVTGADGAGLTVEVKGSVLHVRGTTAISWSDGESLDYRRERPVDARFALPCDADVERMVTCIRHGVLAVCIPKRERLCGSTAIASEASKVIVTELT